MFGDEHHQQHRKYTLHHIQNPDADEYFLNENQKKAQPFDKARQRFYIDLVPRQKIDISLEKNQHMQDLHEVHLYENSKNEYLVQIQYLYTIHTMQICHI